MKGNKAMMEEIVEENKKAAMRTQKQIDTIGEKIATTVMTQYMTRNDENPSHQKGLSQKPEIPEIEEMEEEEDDKLPSIPCAQAKFKEPSQIQDPENGPSSQEEE